MSVSRDEFEKILALQRARYGRSLPAKVAQIQALWDGLQADSAVQPSLHEIERLAHTLGGTAGTLGFADLGLAAQSLERLLAPGAQPGDAWPPGRRSDIALALRRLQSSLPAQEEPGP